MGRRQRRRNREAHRQHALPTAVTAIEDVVDVVDVGGATGRSDGLTERLAELVQQRRQLDVVIDREIDRLAGQKIGWPDIANALGITRQAARQRHHRRGQRP